MKGLSPEPEEEYTDQLLHTSEVQNSLRGEAELK
jgi:hypothetical protein